MVDRLAIRGRRGRRNLAAGQIAKHGEANRCGGGGDRRAGQHAGQDRPAEDGEIGAGFDQAGAAEHFILLQVLRQDRIFDRPEEGRVHAHREHRDEHQRDAGEQQTGAADEHDHDLGRLDDADQPRLVTDVGELASQRRQKEEGEDEQRLGNGAELRFARRIGIELVGDEQDDALLEQAVVERAERLGRE